MNINNLVQGMGNSKQTIKNYNSTKETSGANNNSFKSILIKGTTQNQRPIARTDTIQISHKPITNNEFEVSNLGKKISKDLESETKSEKIDRLSKQIEDNDYKVDPYELATIMFRI